MRQLGYVLPLALAGLVSFAGCRDNEFDYKTWTKKLDDSKESERAVDKLEQLGNPGAIPALGKAWEDAGKPVRMLQAIIAIARPLTPQEAHDTFISDYEKTGRKASWDAALPFLVKALTEVDEANSRSVDSAAKAADAIGEGRLAGGLDALVELGGKPPTKKLIDAQVSAARAIGKLASEKERASAALVKIVDRDPPPHPSTGKTKDAQRALGEKYELYQRVTNAAVNSIGDLHSPAAAKALVMAMYRAPSLFGAYRRALVATGPSAKEELRSVVRGTNTAVDQFLKDKKLDQFCGDGGEAIPCVPVSGRDYYASVVLGDFYDPAVTPDLLEVLKRPALPVYYDGGQPSPNTQWNAVFDAVRKIGAADAAVAVRAVWDVTPKNKDDNFMNRAFAIDAYPFLVRDTAGVAELAKIADDNGNQDQLRQSAATAFARLSRGGADIKVLKNLAKKYFDAAKLKADEAAKVKGAADAADLSLKDRQKKVADAKLALLAMTKDTTKTTEQIKAATAAEKELELVAKDEKDENRGTTAPYKDAMQWVKAYTGFARMFLTHIARIEVGQRCGDDLKCYAATLDTTPEEAKKRIAPLLADVEGDKLADWTPDQLTALVEANVERGMLELGKRGQAASQFTDTLLDHANSTDRIIRQSILLALPKIAKVPCTTCEAKLDAVIKSGAGQLALKDLNTETLMMRNYFGWAGGKTPTPPSDDAAGTPPPAP